MQAIVRKYVTISRIKEQNCYKINRLLHYVSNDISKKTKRQIHKKRINRRVKKSKSVYTELVEVKRSNTKNPNQNFTFNKSPLSCKTTNSANLALYFAWFRLSSAFNKFNCACRNSMELTCPILNFS